MKANLSLLTMMATLLAAQAFADTASITVPAAPVVVVAPTPAPTPIDWDHLPEGPLEQMLVSKEELTQQEANDMAAGIRTAAAAAQIPPFIIYASVKQESDFQPYGILYDYGNYSCSVSQFNILSWCSTFSKKAVDRAAVGWPKSISCDDVSTLNANIMYPIYMAVNARNTVQQTGTTDADILALNPAELIAKMPGATLAYRTSLFKAAVSFASQCNHTAPALRVVSEALKQIHDNDIPKALRKAHPNMAWLLSDAVYNMGDGAIDLMRIYGGKDIWQRLTPQLYVDILAQVLKTKPAADKMLNYVDSDHNKTQVGYFQLCVSQRHVTSITNAGLPVGMPELVESYVDDCEAAFPPK